MVWDVRTVYNKCKRGCKTLPSGEGFSESYPTLRLSRNIEGIWVTELCYELCESNTFEKRIYRVLSSEKRNSSRPINRTRDMDRDTVRSRKRDLVKRICMLTFQVDLLLISKKKKKIRF